MILNKDEEILLKGCRDGDEKAWLALYRAYASDVGFYLKGMMSASTDVDDLVQKVFLGFLSSLDRYRGEASLRTWLHRIARNIALQEIRSRTRREKYVSSYAETVTDTVDSAEGQVAAKNELRIVQQLMEELPDSYREVWVLRELMGFTVSEAALVLDSEEATVRSRHHRARQKILQQLQEVELTVGEATESPQHLRLVSTRAGER